MGVTIDFGSSVTNCNIIYNGSNYAFYNDNSVTKYFNVSGTQWNGKVVVPEGVYHVQINAPKFNAPIKLPKSAHNISFLGCNEFNQVVRFDGVGAINGNGMFRNCFNYNRETRINAAPSSCVQMFENCQKLNKPVFFSINNGYSTVSADRMFQGCNNFNQNVTMPANVTSMVNTFKNCYSLNQSIVIPNSVTKTYGTFENCQGLNRQIEIPGSITNAGRMFAGCNKIAYVRIPSGKANNVFAGAFRENNSLGLTIASSPSTIANIMTTNIISRSNGNTSLSSYIRPTWTAWENNNGYYNTLYNINLYNGFSE